MKKYKHLIFDLDGTLCESRQELSMGMQAALSTTRSFGYDVVIVSGAEVSRIKKQLGLCTVTHMLGQCGTESPFWKHKMSERDEVEVWRHIRTIQRLFPEYNWGAGVDNVRFVENRGSQITFSLSGFDCDPAVKKTFDPHTHRRQVILEHAPFYSVSLECKIAGTTSLDYTHKEYTKGKNILRLIRHLGWYSSDCVYFGDRFFPGGNDETVKGVVECVEVKSPEDLIEKLKEYI